MKSGAMLFTFTVPVSPGMGTQITLVPNVISMVVSGILSDCFSG